MRATAVVIVEISTYLPLRDTQQLASVEQKTHRLRREMLLRVNKLTISDRFSIPDMIRNCPNARIVEMVGPETLERSDFELLSILPIETFTSCKNHLAEWNGSSMLAVRAPIKLRMPRLKSIVVYGAHFYDFSECPVLENISDAYPGATQIENRAALDYIKWQSQIKWEVPPIDWSQLATNPDATDLVSPDQ